MLRCITCRTAISRFLLFVKPNLPFGLDCRFKPSLLVVMNSVGLQALSTGRVVYIIRMGGRYELRKVTCQDQAHSVDTSCGALCVTVSSLEEHQHAPRSR